MALGFSGDLKQVRLTIMLLGHSHREIANFAVALFIIKVTDYYEIIISSTIMANCLSDFFKEICLIVAGGR